MQSKAFDILLIAISGVIAYFISMGYPDVDKIEMDGIYFLIIPVIVTLSTLIVYMVFTKAFKNFYAKYRWWVVGFFCAVNMADGLLLYSGSLI